MTVLIVAYPFAPVGPDAVGGAEQVLSALDAALVQAGHTSLVVASHKSQVYGELIPLPAPQRSLQSIEVTSTVHQSCREAIREVLATRSIDLIHMHGIDFHCYLPPPGAPVLATLHLPVAWYPPEIFRMTRAKTFLHCVSDAQDRDCPPCDSLLPPIPNGVAIPPGQTTSSRDYALAIGRICPEKGFHLAIDAATRAGVPLRLAGKVFAYEAHEKYFREEIQPRLKPGTEFLGPVGGTAKAALYANARCLLVTSTVAETSSLVALEALSHGTPVIAFRIGALPDIIEDGVTGFLVDDAESMAQAIQRVAEIDPQSCRKAARESYSLERMTARYFDVYRSLSAHHKR